MLQLAFCGAMTRFHRNELRQRLMSNRRTPPPSILNLRKTVSAVSGMFAMIGVLRAKPAMHRQNHAFVGRNEFNLCAAR